MSRGKTLAIGLIIALAACILAMPFTANAASKPAQPVITNLQSEQDIIAVSWSAADNADSYKVFVQQGTDKWKLFKKVKKSASNKKKYADKLKFKLKTAGKKYKVYNCFIEGRQG